MEHHQPIQSEISAYAGDQRQERVSTQTNVEWFCEKYQVPDLQETLEAYRTTFPPVTFKYFHGVVDFDGQRRGYFDPARIRRLCAHLFTRLHENDEYAPVHNSQLWSLNPHHHGLADFIVEAAITDIHPKSVTQLLAIARTLPTLEGSCAHQNRLDGTALVQVFPKLRDLIHEQVPTHDLIVGMVKWFETDNDVLLRLSFDRLRSYLKLYPSEVPLISNLIDRDRYDVQGYQSSEKVISILRRLMINTVSIPDAPPTVSDDELAPLLIPAATDQAVFVQMLAGVNARLIESQRQGTIGLSPMKIQLLGWLDRLGARILRGLTCEQTLGIHRSPLLKELITFHELTGSPNTYDSAEVNRFLQSIADPAKNADKESAGCIRYDLLARPVHEHAAFLIANRVHRQVAELAKDWTEATALDTGAIWSGNLTHELTRLAEPRLATTSIGQRLQRETHHSGD